MPKNQAYIAKITITDVNWVIVEMKKGEKYLSIGDDTCGISSNRIRTYTKGIACKCCGLEIKYFSFERQANQATSSLHLNAYGIRSDGEHVMMTSDHIIPKSKGGPNTLENREPMCARCNRMKGTLSWDEFMEIGLEGLYKIQAKNKEASRKRRIEKRGNRVGVRVFEANGSWYSSRSDVHEIKGPFESPRLAHLALGVFKESVAE